MSEGNGVIRVGKKGKKKFAFGDSEPFEVDVVVAFYGWINIDETFRENQPDRVVPTADMPRFHQAAVEYVANLSGVKREELTTAEALDFLARLRECYNEVADFFHARSRQERASPTTSGVELQFSEEPTQN